MLIYAYESGITVFDTAELYQNYEHLAGLLKVYPDAAVITKCYAFDKEGAQKSLEKALRGINRDYIDVFMLHEQESELTLKGHKEAIDYFINKKQEGIIKAFGVSTHYVRCAAAAAQMKEIDVIEALINKGGFGIADGTEQLMAAELKKATANGKGVIAMKPLAGGHYIRNAADSLRYVKELDYINTVAVGMQNEQEIDYNIKLFDDNNDIDIKYVGLDREMHIADWCKGCGKCQARCANGAIKVSGGKAKVNMKKCVLCGYCASVCPEFCIKVY